MEPSSIIASTRDLWSNVKIPNLASVQISDSLLSPTWTNITSDRNLTYSSLLGIPLSGLPQDGRTTTTLETSYFTLMQDENQSNDNSIGNLTFGENPGDNMDNGTWHWGTFPESEEVATQGLFMAIDGFNIADGNFSLWYDVYDRYSSDTEFVPQAPRHLALFSQEFQYQRIYTLSTTYVETAISCDGLSSLCQATAIRISEQPHINSNISNLAYSDTWIAFAEHLNIAAIMGQSGMPTITEAYMNDPSTVAATSLDFGQLTYNLTATDDQLQIRAQQLLNSYWQASVNPAVSIVGLKNELIQMGNVRTRSVEGIHETSTTVYKVNWAWWLVFMCATSAMLAFALLALTIDCVLRGPEILGYCTTSLRDSPFAKTGRGAGSAMGGAERARKWKDVEVKLTDVKGGEDVGYIAVAEVESTGHLAMENWGEELKRGRRLYA